MFNAKSLQEKWAPVLGHEGAASIKDNYRKSVTAVLLENQERFLREERGMPVSYTHLTLPTKAKV